MDSRIEIRPGRIVNITTYNNPSSKATVFLIHGLGGRSQQWREQIKPLKEKYTLIIPDLLGHGKSDKPVSNTANLYSFTEFDQDLHAIFNRFSSDKNIIIGHSYGGALATSLAIDHQDKVSKLVLICPVACTPSVKIPLVYHLPVFMLEWLRPTLEKQFLRLAFDESTSSALIAEEAEASRANPMYVIKSIISGMKEIPQLDVTMLTIPTDIILGEHDEIVPPAISQQFYSAIPQHQFEMITHAAHMEMLEKPEQINKLMIEFLSR